MVYINYNKVIIPDNEPVYIYPIGDLHIGHENCNLDFVISYIESIPKNQNNRIILMGDLMDCGTKTSIGASVYENYLTPQEQIDLLIKLLEPYKEQIDGFVMGNHEYRITKDTGVDVCKIISDKLEIPYHKYSGIITYSMNHKAYNINYFHGRAGGGVENALRKAKEMSNKIVCDVYLMGHVHQCAYTRRLLKIIDSRNEKITDTNQFFVLTGHALEYENSYAEQANLEISPKGFPVIHLNNTNKLISINCNNCIS